MPRSAIQLHLPQPCHEAWAAMTPTAAGLHCAACAKTVVDFTQKTDAEILAQLARAGASPCGRFRADQLARPLQPAETTSRWRSWLASGLALGGVLGSGRAAAQASGNYFSAGPTSATVQPAAAPAPAEAKPTTPPAPAVPAGGGGPLVVRGKVTDAASDDRLPGVTVLLKGTSQGVSTDAEGEFILEIPAAANGTLVVSFVGYTRQELPVSGAVGAVPATIKLAADAHILGNEVVIYAGGISMCSVRQPWPWHPRRLYQWGKYQLARPFRR